MDFNRLPCDFLALPVNNLTLIHCLSNLCDRCVLMSTLRLLPPKRSRELGDRMYEMPGLLSSPRQVRGKQPPRLGAAATVSAASPSHAHLRKPSVLWCFESTLAGLFCLLRDRHVMPVPDVSSISSGQLVLLFVQSCPSPLKTWLLTDLNTFSRAVTLQIQLTQSHTLDSRSATVEQPRSWPGVAPE